MTGITVAHWGEIGHDTLEFYNFSHKTWADVVAFYLLAVVVLCFHEVGHAHACKNYGARVPAMGFALIYLTPGFLHRHYRRPGESQPLPAFSNFRCRRLG